MKIVAALSGFLFSALSFATAIPDGAFPLEVVSSRPLEERGRHDHHGHYNERDDQCPTDGTLPPGYLAPTLMVRISKNSPDVEFGSTQIPLITPNDFCTIFNLEIPSSGFDKTCTLEFLFPNNEETWSPYSYDGPGHFTFTGYSFFTGATNETTYNTQPPPGPSPLNPPAVLAPGNAYVINAGPCFIPPGVSSMEVSGKLCSPDTSFSYLQNANNGCPIGFYVIIS